MTHRNSIASLLLVLAACDAPGDAGATKDVAGGLDGAIDPSDANVNVDTDPGPMTAADTSADLDTLGTDARLGDFTPSTLVVEYDPQDWYGQSARIVLIDASPSPTICSLGENMDLTPVGKARAISFEVEYSVSGGNLPRDLQELSCSDSAGSTSLTFRVFEAGARVASMDSTAAAITATPDADLCRLDIEARFPSGETWVNRLWLPYYVGYGAQDRCDSLSQ